MERLKPKGRTLEEFEPLGPGEQLLLEACRTGEVATLGTATPTEVTDAQRVRAPFLRFLLLGGDERAPLHEHGVRLRGAFVEGTVDLQGCRIPASVALNRCYFDSKIFAMDAQVDGLLNLQGSHLTYGLAADRLRCSTDVFLRNGFKATGEVRLLGAQIDGALSCQGGQFEVKEGNALSADRLVIKGSVFLNDGFEATGQVRLLGAQIDGNLSCNGGQFAVKKGNALTAERAVVKGSVFLNDGFKATGQVRLLGVQIDGNLSCRGGQFEGKNDVALSLAGAVVRGTWRLDGLPQPVLVDASHADVAVLEDELAAWASGSVLDGLRYAALGGRALSNGMDRLEWLRKQGEEHLGIVAGGANFCPQPWRQMQRVLREMGHTEDAKRLGIAFEDHLRDIGRVGSSPPGTPAPLAWLKRVAAQGAHYAFGKLAGYGYRPIRLVAWMVSVWLLCGALYWCLALPPHSALAPSDPLVFHNERYKECLPDDEVKPGNWYLCSPLRAEYATFSPFAFSLDVMLPLVDLGQEKTWGAFVPTPKENPLEELFGHRHWGHWARLLIWLETLFGWLSSLLLVAIVSGFSRRNDEE